VPVAKSSNEKASFTFVAKFPNINSGKDKPMRIFGVNIPDNKRIEVSLTYLYGVGQAASKKALAAAKIGVDKRAKELTADEILRIQNFLEKNYPVEGELRQLVRSNINRLKELQTYRGLRHMRRLPVRGQRTRTNSRTVRGNVRKTAGSGKRKVDLK
jgi:small subunit ribosomal protein S13